MGAFSWNCAKCERPVLGFNYPGYNKFRKIAVVYSDGGRMFGRYDGYGRLVDRELDLVDDVFRRVVKLVHRCCYKNESFDDLGESEHDDTQGSGYVERKMVAVFGEPDLSECEERHYACAACRKTFVSKFSRGVCAYGCAPAKHETVFELTDTEVLAQCEYSGCPCEGEILRVEDNPFEPPGALGHLATAASDNTYVRCAWDNHPARVVVPAPKIVA